MLHRIRVPALFLIPLMLVACADEMRPPAPSSGAGYLTLNTSLGPVDVVAFRKDPSGSPGFRVHAVYPDGHHAVRDIGIRIEDDPLLPGAARVVHSVWADGIERVRLTRNAPSEDAFASTIEAAGERLHLAGAVQGPAVRFQVTLLRGQTTSHWETLLDPGRARESAYVAGVKESLRAFYGDGPLAANDDLSLLVAVLESPDWADPRAEAALLPAGGDAETRRRILQVCTGAAIASKVSCFLSRFTPWAMVVCIPATGINIACVIYNVAQLAMSPDQPPPPRPCTCGCGCGE